CIAPPKVLDIYRTQGAQRNNVIDFTIPEHDRFSAPKAATIPCGPDTESGSGRNSLAFDTRCRTVGRISRGHHLPQSSSASRLTAGAAGFLLLTQCRDRPER